VFSDARVLNQLGSEVFFVPSNAGERFVKVDVVSSLLNSCGEIQPHEVPIVLPVAEPSRHLHQSVCSNGHSGIQGHGQSFDCEPTAEFGSTDENLPNTLRRVEIDLCLLVFGFLRTIDQNHGVRGTIGLTPSIDELHYSRNVVLEVIES